MRPACVPPSRHGPIAPARRVQQRRRAVKAAAVIKIPTAPPPPPAPRNHLDGGLVFLSVMSWITAAASVSSFVVLWEICTWLFHTNSRPYDFDRLLRQGLQTHEQVDRLSEEIKRLHTLILRRH